MKGVVLAGGKGSRLRPFTYSGAKQLVPVANKPILFYAFEQLAAAGIEDVAIIVGDTQDQIRAAAGDGSLWGLRLNYIRQDRPAGIAHAILQAQDYVGSEDFVCYLGDNFLRGGISDHAQRFAAAGADAQVLLHRVPNPEEFGIAHLDGERLVEVVEKPGVLSPADPALGDLAVIGVYFFTPCVFDVIPAQQPSARGELEISDTISALLRDGRRVVTASVDGYWIDTGKMDDILEANRVALRDLPAAVDGEVRGSSLHGNVSVEGGAEVLDSVIEGPCAITAGTVVRNSRIGPATAIGPFCTIVDAEIDGSIVMERTTIESARLTSSLVGRDVLVRNLGAPARLVLGDHSQVEGSG
jgi:glucose-1-phosphate thymidylyltransferase